MSDETPKGYTDMSVAYTAGFTAGKHDAADALEAQARRLEHLHNDMKFMDGKNDELRALLESDRYTIDELRARLAELEAQVLAGNDWLNARSAVLQELAEANARIAELKAALKPFAEWETFTAADIRAARAALEKKE